MSSLVRLWTRRLGASVLGVIVAAVLAMVLLPLLGEATGAVASLGIGVLVARSLSD